MGPHGRGLGKKGLPRTIHIKKIDYRNELGSVTLDWILRLCCCNNWSRLTVIHCITHPLIFRPSCRQERAASLVFWPSQSDLDQHCTYMTKVYRSVQEEEEKANPKKENKKEILYKTRQRPVCAILTWYNSTVLN